MKSDLKTKVNDASVSNFLKSIPDSAQRADCSAVFQIMRNATGMAPKMRGHSIREQTDKPEEAMKIKLRTNNGGEARGFTFLCFCPSGAAGGGR